MCALNRIASAKAALEAFRSELSDSSIQSVAQNSPTFQFLHFLLQQFDSHLDPAVSGDSSAHTFATSSGAAAQFLAKHVSHIVINAGQLDTSSLRQQALQAIGPWLDQKQAMMTALGEARAALSKLCSISVHTLLENKINEDSGKHDESSAVASGALNTLLSSSSNALMQLDLLLSQFPLMDTVRTALSPISAQLLALNQETLSPVEMATRFQTLQQGIQPVFQVLGSLRSSASSDNRLRSTLLALIPSSQISNFLISQLAQLQVDGVIREAEHQFDTVSDRFCEFVLARVPAWVICALLKLPREQQVYRI
jgi:hypothetical protein